MAIQEETVSGATAHQLQTDNLDSTRELTADAGILNISEAEALDLMYCDAFEGLYTGPHAYTVDVLMANWGYKSRSPIDKRMAEKVESGIVTKVKIPSVAGARPLNAWVLTEIYNVWEASNGDSK